MMEYVRLAEWIPYIQSKGKLFQLRISRHIFISFDFSDVFWRREKIKLAVFQNNPFSLQDYFFSTMSYCCKGNVSFCKDETSGCNYGVSTGLSCQYK